ncbi:hypothetical protein SCUP515_09935 [Seiridium cupressi]
MSQRGPASRPVSPPSIRSPASAHHDSPATHRSSLRGGGDPSSEDGSQESSSVSRSHEERPRLVQRSSGVYNILNPSSHQSPPMAATSPVAPGLVGRGSPVNVFANQYGSSPSMQRPLLFQGQGAPAQQHIRGSSGEGFAAMVSTSRRDSPGTVHPLPALGGPRRYLTARSPRASSLSQGPLPRATTVQQPFYPPSSTTEQTRTFARDVADPRSPSIHPGPPLTQPSSGPRMPGILPPGNVPNLNTQSRSSSQPMLSRSGPPAQEIPPRRQETPDQPHRAPMFPPPSSYATSIPPTGRGFPALSPADPRWPPLLGGQQGVRSTGMPEEQSTLVFATPGGEPVEFTIDKTNGSRQADEKRQRNAGASARFRQRKKDKDQQKEAMIEKLQAQNRELERRLRDLETERERYRAERDRLRDVVRRAPSISEFAFQGPRSPPPRGASSLGGRGLLEGVPPPPPLSNETYGAGDPITGERSSRRRRTDPQLEFGPGAFASTLPPPNYSAPMSQPGTPSAGTGLERLPPLRLDQASGMPITSAGTSSNAPTPGFSPIKHESYELGWVARPSGPQPDPGRR